MAIVEFDSFEKVHDRPRREKERDERRRDNVEKHGVVITVCATLVDIGTTYSK